MRHFTQRKTVSLLAVTRWNGQASPRIAMTCLRQRTLPSGARCTRSSGRRKPPIPAAKAVRTWSATNPIGHLATSAISRPTGEELLEAESDEATRPEKFRNKVYRSFDDVTDAAKDQSEAVQNLLERPQPAGHPEVAVPSRPEIVSASSQQGPIDAGTMVETFLVVGVLGYELGRWLRHKVNGDGRS